MAKRAEAQSRRFAEVQQLRQAEWQTLYASMHSAAVRLPKGAQHFEDHRDEFEDLGIRSVEAYQVLFQRHLQSPTLRHFTYISSKPPHPRLWAMVGMDNGVVSLYNETRKRHWSLFRPPSLDRYLDSGKGWWIEVDFGKAPVRVEKYE